MRSFSCIGSLSKWKYARLIRVAFLVKCDLYLAQVETFRMENVTLDCLKVDQTGVVREITGDSRFISRIISIGLTPNSSFTVLKNDGSSPMLVYCRDTMIAINRKECAQIGVSV